MKSSSSLRGRARKQRIRTIIVPIDFSDCSLAGLKYAVKFARDVSARILVLHVTDLGPVMMTTSCGAFDSPAYLEAARRRCGERMKAFLKRVDLDGVSVDMFAVPGYCPAAIYDFAAKHDADLIIISTHGRTGLRHAFLGSVAEETVRRAGRPVLVVPSFPAIREERVTKPARERRRQHLQSSSTRK